jgi:hypothetical protein
MVMRVFSSLFAALMALNFFAQNKTYSVTMYPQNKTAMVTLNDGRTVKAANSNIFMKNAALIYLQGTEIKEARMDIIAKVDFDDRKFVNIENKLAYFVDSIGGNSLYCIELIDMDAYKRNLQNNVNFTHIDLSSERLESNVNNLNTEEDFQLPIFKHFYFVLNGKVIQAHDRELYRALDKEKYRKLKTAIILPDFSWTDEASLMKLLKMISQ